jgi:hypothetical protein
MSLSGLSFEKNSRSINTMAIAKSIAKKSQLNTSQAKKGSAYSIVIFFFLYIKNVL